MSRFVETVELHGTKIFVNLDNVELVYLSKDEVRLTTVACDVIRLAPGVINDFIKKLKEK